MNDGLDLDEDIIINKKDWDNDLLGCGGDITTCLYATCCPCIASGEIFVNGEIGDHCIVGCLLYSCLGCIYPCIVTGGIRKKRHINGSCITDYLFFCCCNPCELTKILREVREVRDERGT